jgi:sialidase-1
VAPESTDFTLGGATDIVVDATNHTVNFTYDPNLAIVIDGVTVAQGWQTAGRDNEVMLMRVYAKPFKDATGTTMTVSLKDGAEANISKLTLYEASSESPEIYSTGTGAPTKTVVAEVNNPSATAAFSIGSFAAGQHYYWIGATVKSDATLGDILDAAVTGITYTCNGNETTLDLTSVGDPADRGAMVFNAHSYPYLPRDNGSRVYRIPAMIVADDGSIVVAADKRYESYTDIGAGHVIDIVIRRSTDGGKTWSDPKVVAKGLGTADNAKCGYGDPSLVKGKDGKLYCLFVAGNLGYFYGQQRIAMTTSSDNGVTWSSNETTPPIDLLESGRLKNYNTVGQAGYGLYDYFVTSGRGLYIPDDDILMYLIPAQTMTSATEHTGDSQDYIFYSRDGGESWYFSETPMINGGDEAKIIQMNDGSLFGSIRKYGDRRFNTATYTKNDDGKTLSFTFGTQWDNSQLHQDSQNNQDILYYQRETETGKTDVIIHSITTGNHANFKLYYSTDQGINWTEFLNVQTKGARYVTMDKNPANGSLYLFFEDQSLNSAGGYTDYNHYPLNFIEITREHLKKYITNLDDYNVPDFLEIKDVKNSVYQTSTGCDFYGSLTNGSNGHWARTWTSNASSGMAGLTISTESGYGFDKATVLGTRVMTLKPSADGATDTYTITAPAGYIIKGYTIGGAVYTNGTYRITAADGTTTGDITSTTTPTNITVTGVNASSTNFQFYGASQNNWFAITNLVITLAKPLALNVVGDKSYATLYVPFDVETDADTKAYYITEYNNDTANLTEVEGGLIPANTAVVLINDKAATQTTLEMTSALEPVVSEDENLLKGTLVPMKLDLSDETPNYSLGRLKGNIGFYKFKAADGTSTITLGANKAYLKVPVPTSNNVRGFKIGFAGDDSIVSDDGGFVDGINEVQTTGENVIYDLNGLRVSTLRKGVYIVNGKKVVIK